MTLIYGEPGSTSRLAVDPCPKSAPVRPVDFGIHARKRIAQ